jgi:glycosyltransferase involved in cell wall biosynthesis
VSKFSQHKHIESSQLYQEKSNHLYNFTLITPVDKIEKEKYLLFLGRISEEKGISTLINAVSGLDISIKIAGTGPLLDELKKQQNEYIEFVGFKSGKELTRLIQNASFVVVPSEWYENNPLSVIEAMMLGTPVIGSNIGGIPELIINEKTGFLFDSKNAEDIRKKILKAVALSPEAYDLMSEEAIKFAHENFSSHSHYQKLIGIYLKTIKNHRK